MADPSSVSIVIPAMNEEDAIGDVVARPARGGALAARSSSSTTARATRPAARARRPARDVIRHPYNKGNGAAVKTGHPPSATASSSSSSTPTDSIAPDDARRLVQRLGEYDLVIGARSAQTQATIGRRVGNALLNRLASYLTGRPIPDLTSGFRGARREYLREFLHLLPNGFSTPTTTTLAFIKAGYNVAFEPVEARPRIGQSKIRFARDGAKFFLILLKVITIFSPLRVFVPISVASLLLGVVYGLVNFAMYGRIPNGAVILILFAVIVFLVGLVSEQISSLRFDGHSRS